MWPGLQEGGAPLHFFLLCRAPINYEKSFIPALPRTNQPHVSVQEEAGHLQRCRRRRRTLDISDNDEVIATIFSFCHLGFWICFVHCPALVTYCHFDLRAPLRRVTFSIASPAQVLGLPDPCASAQEGAGDLHRSKPRQRAADSSSSEEVRPCLHSFDSIMFQRTSASPYRAVSYVLRKEMQM